MRTGHWLLALLLGVSLGGCAPKPYGAPPETDDPWVLIYSARSWLERGRPRGALPSLNQAFVALENLEPGTPRYLHAKASIHNEVGRAYLMAGRKDWAEENFLLAVQAADEVPDRRALRFEVLYNLSTLYEGTGDTAQSCSYLHRAAELHRDLLAHPADPPHGYGAGGEQFLRGVAEPKINQRNARLRCEVGESL
jgi:tetratricopeptide (TPR) repeat protein